jgi:hypothetical protein
MALGIGAKARLTLKEEVTWGTFVTSPTARDVQARIVSDEIETKKNTFESPALGSRTVSQLFDGETEVDAPMDIEVGFEGALPWLLKHCLGGYDFNINSPVASANTHIFNPKQDLPPGLSGEICVGGIPADNLVVRYPGIKVSKMELSLEQGKILSCKANLIPKDEDANLDVASPYGYTALEYVSGPLDSWFTPPALKPVKFWYQGGYGTLIIAGQTITKCRNWKFTIENDLQRRFNLSQTTDEPFPGSTRKVTFDALIEFTDWALYRKFKKAIDGSFVLNLPSGPGSSLNDQSITGTTPYSLLIAGNNARITTTPRPKQTDAGILTAQVSCQLYAPSGAELQITLVNGQATCGAEIL